MREEGTHLSINEQNLRKDYRQDALFCACTFMLNKLKRNGEIPLSDVAVWYEAERIRKELLACNTNRDIEICHIHTELEEQYRQLYDEEQAQNAVVVVLFILLMQMASADPGDGSTHPNEELQYAICRELTDDDAVYAYFLKLRHSFKESMLSNRKELVIPVKDYMKADPETKPADEVQKTFNSILEHTKPLEKELLCIDWETYSHIWLAICADKDLWQKLEKDRPQNNGWECNVILVLNVLGMLRNTTFRDANGKQKSCLEGSTREIARTITKEHRRTYIDNPVPNPNNNKSLFTKNKYLKVKGIITEVLERRNTL